MTGRKIALICRVLGIGRATAYREGTPRGRRYVKSEDRMVTAQIRDVIRTRATYGSRRTRALVNRVRDGLQPQTHSAGDGDGRLEVASECPAADWPGAHGENLGHAHVEPTLLPCGLFAKGAEGILLHLLLAQDRASDDPDPQARICLRVVTLRPSARRRSPDHTLTG